MSTPQLTSNPLPRRPERAGIECPPPVLTERLAILLLFFSSLALYAVTVRFEFVYDDILLLTQNPYVDSFHYLKEIFTQDFWSFQGAPAQTGYYRPLVMLTLLLEKQLFGLRPEYFHLVNILLNCLVVVLCYRLGKCLWPEGQGAFWGALLFSVLPVHGEVVTPVSGLSDLECGMLLLITILVYLRFQNCQGLKAVLAGCLVGGVFCLAVLSKEVALVLPLLVLFYEFGVREREARARKHSIARIAPLLLLTAGYLLLRYEIFGALFDIRHSVHHGLKAQLLSGMALLGQYAFVTVWPQHLTAYRSFHSPVNWTNVDVLLGGVSVLIGAAAFRRGWKAQRRTAFAVAWIFLTLGPVLDIRFLAASAYGERYLFIPSMALCWLAGEGLGRFSSRGKGTGPRRVVAWGFPALIVLLLGARTAWRLPDWKNEESLARATLREDPGASPFLIRLGNVYRLRGEVAKARQMYVASLAANVYAEGYINLAGTFVDQGLLAPARVFYQRAVTLAPGLAEGYYAWGVAELNEGDADLARRLFRRVVELEPAHADALNNLGALELSQGKVEEAQELLRRALRARPGMVTAHLNLGNALFRAGQQAPAEAEYRRAIRLAPSDEIPYLALASLLEQEGRIPEALQTYRTVLEFKPPSANAAYQFGVLALKTGNVSEAIQTLELATKLRPRWALPHAELGRAYRAAGLIAKARQELDVALQLDPQNPTARQYRRQSP